MSQEFEKIVLEKLNKMDEKLDEHTKILNEHSELLNEHTKVLKEHSKKIAKNSEEIADLTELVKIHHNTILKFDYDFRKKIDTLFDAYEVVNTKVETNSEMIKDLKANYFKHGIRISSLEDVIKKNSATV